MEMTEKKHFWRKFVGNKAFYLMVLSIAIPIMIQNGITNFVSLLDNIMIGRIGTEPMSGAAIVNQLIFVYNLCIFGGVPAPEYLRHSILEKEIRRASAIPCATNCGW